MASEAPTPPNIQRLREGLSFTEQIFNRYTQMNETRTRRQENISKMEQSLQEFREGQMRANRDEIESLIDQKIRNVQNAVQRDKPSFSFDIKVSLDLEIAAYDTLLRGEEQRLNTANGLFGSFWRFVRGTPAAKRKRTADDEADEITYTFAVCSTSTGAIEITKSDPDGNFVELHNKSDKEVAIGGWQLNRKAGDNETIFEFDRSVKMDGGADVVVWSADSDITESDGNLIMKSQKWFVGEEMRTTLVNADGKEEATNERVCRPVVKRSKRFRTNSGQVHRENGENQEKCSVM